MMLVPRYRVWMREVDQLPESEVFSGLPTPGVYAIQAGEDWDGPIKIGMAQNVGARFDALQTGHYEELYLRLICQTETCTVESLGSLERLLHEQFEPLRIRGEWFASGELTDTFVTWPEWFEETLRPFWDVRRHLTGERQ